MVELVICEANQMSQRRHPIFYYFIRRRVLDLSLEIRDVNPILSTPILYTRTHSHVLYIDDESVLCEEVCSHPT